MYEPTNVYLFILAYSLENYLEADEGEADQLMAALPKVFVEELQQRILRILKGGDPKQVLEAPGFSGGRPPETIRNFCIALEFHSLRERENEKYDVAIMQLQERWELSETGIKSAIKEYSGDAYLKLVAQLSRKWSNIHNLLNLSEKYSQLPPIV